MARMCLRNVADSQVKVIFASGYPYLYLYTPCTWYSSYYSIQYHWDRYTGSLDASSPRNLTNTPNMTISTGYAIRALYRYSTTTSYYGTSWTADLSGGPTPISSWTSPQTINSVSKDVFRTSLIPTPSMVNLNNSTYPSGMYLFCSTSSIGQGGTFQDADLCKLEYLSFALTVSATGSGTATGGGSITDGETATLTATATNGASFLGWYLGGTTLVSTSLSYTTPAITAAASYVAKFQEAYTVTASTNNSTYGNGYIGVSGTDNTGTYLENATVTLRAVANTGYQFVQWERSGVQVSTSATVNISVSSTTYGTYTAYFQAVSVSVSVSSNDSLLGDSYVGESGTDVSASVSYGASVTLRAIAKTMDASPSFVNWTKDGVEVSTSATYTFTSSLLANTAYVANFSQVKWMVSAAVNSSDSDKGSVKINGNSVSSYWASSSETVTVLATPSNSTKYRFTKWQKNSEDFTGNTANPYSFANGTSNNEYTTFFEQYKWLLTTASDNTTVGYTDIVQSSVSLGASYWLEKELSVSIRAYVRSAYTDTYKFLEWRWTDNTGTARTSTSETLIISSEQRDVSYTAFFVQTYYTLSVSSVNSLYGSVSLTVNGQAKVTTTGVSVKAGDAVVVGSIPSYGYSFSNWSISGSVVSSLASYSFTMPYAATTIVGNFVQKTKVATTLTIVNPDLGSISVQRTNGTVVGDSGSDSTLSVDLYLGESYKLVASASGSLNQFDGYFKYYEEELRLVQADGTMTFSVASTATIAYTCKFSVRTNYTVSKTFKNVDTAIEDAQIVTDGCEVNISTESDGEIDGVPVWLSGQYIDFSVVEAGDWYIRQIEVRDSTNASIFSSTYDASSFSTTASFRLNDNCTIVCWYQSVIVPNLYTCSAGFKGSAAGGEVSIYPEGLSRNTTASGVTGRFYDGTEVVISAMPYPGYKFSGWYLTTASETPFSTSATYRSVLSGGGVAAYALFTASTGSVSAFNLGATKKTFEWRGRHIALTRPENFSCGCVNSSDYPVVMQIGSASSPSTTELDSKRVDVAVTSQDSIRLPIRRPELFASVGIKGTGRIISVAVSTNMTELRK